MNTVSKERLVQQMRLYDKIEQMLSGVIAEDNMNYLFLLHLVSGIVQSAQGGMTSREFSACSDFEKYKKQFRMFGKIKKDFFRNEHSSFLGRIRIHVFIFLMRHRFYRMAGKVMGLK